jgi:hypothetical protein
LAATKLAEGTTEDGYAEFCFYPTLDDSRRLILIKNVGGNGLVYQILASSDDIWVTLKSETNLAPKKTDYEPSVDPWDSYKVQLKSQIVGNPTKYEVWVVEKAIAGAISSNPASGEKKVRNIYWLEKTSELVFDHE